MSEQQIDIAEQIHAMGRDARRAARQVAALSGDQRSAMLSAMAASVRSSADAIAAANAIDLAQAKADGLDAARIDRLALTPDRIESMATGIDDVARMHDPIGQILETIIRPNGLCIEKTRVPLGVIGMVYESRPNVTADAAALALKAGNAVILRGGKEAMHSNRAILDAMKEGLRSSDGPEHAVQLIGTADRAAARALFTMDDCVDLLIPRGGESLIRAVAEQATVPVLKHYKGVCHVYVDASADMDMAHDIVVNAKVQRPGVCNAAETLLVHRSIAVSFLPGMLHDLVAQGVEIRGDERTRAAVPNLSVSEATDDDWFEEYLDLVLSVRVVDSVDDAIDHIEHYGSHHSESIVTDDLSAAAKFLQNVDSAAVYHNASTRFTDGSEFGMGAEIGISTDKLHARGPCGINELTTYKYIGRGDGQIRE